MVTKEGKTDLKDKQNTFINENNRDNQYSNINLNGNYTCLSTSLVQSHSKTTTTGKNCDAFRTDKNEGSNYVSTYTKPANRLEQVQEMFERRKANDQNDIPEKDLLNSSTLSLHIAAYENSAEASAHTNECNEVKEGSNNGKSWFYKKAKQFIAGPVSTVQNPLEFPRQQKNQTGEPDVMQFKASQRLRNPNDSAGNQIMESARGNSGGRGRGRGSRGGRGRGGGGGARGRGRGRGGGNFNNQDQGHRVGDRIVLSSVDAGFAPPSPPAKSSYRSRPVQTGTEEILGNIVEYENDLPNSHPKKSLFTKQKEAKKIVAETAAADLSDDDDIDMSELPETSPDGLITQLRERPTIKKSDKKPEINGYKDIWERGQYNRVTRVIGDFPKAKDRCFVARPIPRAQPVHYMNKFARQKLPLAEPQFRKIKAQPPMTFTSQAVYQQFRGTEACSKVAGHVLADIIKNPHFFRKLFSIQIPNSLKVFSSDGDSTDDILIAKQNVMKNNAENESASAAAALKSQPLKMKKPRYHCLTQFASDQPFGKLQLLKSGRVVLRVGSRVFDVCTSTQNHDTHVGAIFEHESTEEKPRAPPTMTSNGNLAATHHHQDNLFLLGKIEHFFTAYYDYQKILKELDSSPNSG